MLVKLFLQFVVFQWNFDLPQVKQYLIPSIVSLVYELPHELPNNWRLRNLFQNWPEKSLAGSLTSRIQFLAIADQTYKIADTEDIFCFCLELLDFS